VSVADPTARLNRALAIAAEAHAGQLKRGHEPFMAHVTRVVASVEGIEVKIVAALHDVIEKSDWTLDRLADEGFSPEILAAVGAMTKRPGERFDALVQRAVADPLARAVKMADLRDNLSGWERGRPSAERRERVARYRRALAELNAPGEVA